MEQVTPGWRCAHIGVEGDGVEIVGVKLWEVPWGRTQGQITVAHPHYPNQRHPMWVYRLSTPSGSAEFAAGEFSNGVWAFFVRDGVDL